MKRKKSTGPRRDSCGIPRRTRRSDLRDFKNSLRKIKNLIESRPSRTETIWQGERIELAFRKKSRLDRKVSSKSFETHGERERQEGSRKDEGLFYLMDGDRRRYLPDRRKGM